MNRKLLIVSSLLLLALVMGYNGCGTEKVINDLKSSTLGNPYTTQAAPQILTSVCTVLSQCNSNVTMAACMNGVRNTSGIGQRLGTSSYTVYSSVLDAESSGSIWANPVSTTECLSDLSKLACTSPEVVGAYNPSAVEPYGGVRDMLDMWQYSCAGVFAGDQVLFADGFESGNSSAFNSEEPSSSYPATASVPGGCHTGNFCGAQSLTSNPGEQEAFWHKFVYFLPDRSYVRAYYKFPSNWQFTSNAERLFNLMAVGWNCMNGLNVAMKSRGGNGQVADLVAYSYKPEDIIHVGNSFTPDGNWHSVELFSSVSEKRVRVWFDGNLVIDVADEAGGCVGAEVQIGTVVNPGSELPKNETFYIDDIVISRERIGP